MNDLVNFTLGSATLAVTVENNEPYFNLLEIAEHLGYTQPLTAIRDFYKSYSEEIMKFGSYHCLPQNAAELRIAASKVQEGMLYSFLMNSRAPLAREWQTFICYTVLPKVRQLGLEKLDQALKERLAYKNRLLCSEALHYKIKLADFERLVPRETWTPLVRGGGGTGLL